MEDNELEKLIVQGLQMDRRNYLAVQDWLETTFIALAPFPEERHRLELACFSNATPEEKIEQGLEILNDATDRLLYTRLEPLCILNCE
jgi:hypothetical protein